MRGKAGLVIGLAAGYVLGSRAGRERYEQIKEQAEKVWNLEPVQKQVAKVQDLGKSALMALPSALWNGAVKVTKAASTKGTPGQRLDAALDAGDDAKDEVADAAEKSAEAAEKAVKNLTEGARSAGSRSPGAAKRSGGGSSAGGK
jgi:acetoin utilization deacetylase AcuC-like enzyme